MIEKHEDAEEAPDKKKRSRRIIQATRWNEYHDWPPIGGLRHLAFFAKTNGFAKAFLKVGRRLLIDEEEFFRVIQEKNAEQK